MRRLPPHLPRTGPSSRAGRNWHLPLRGRAGGGCRGFIGPCPSAPLDEWNAPNCTQPTADHPSSVPVAPVTGVLTRAVHGSTIASSPAPDEEPRAHEPPAGRRRG